MFRRFVCARREIVRQAGVDLASLLRDSDDVPAKEVTQVCQPDQVIASCACTILSTAFMNSIISCSQWRCSQVEDHRHNDADNLHRKLLAEVDLLCTAHSHGP